MQCIGSGVQWEYVVDCAGTAEESVAAAKAKLAVRGHPQAFLVGEPRPAREEPRAALPAARTPGSRTRKRRRSERDDDDDDDDDDEAIARNEAADPAGRRTRYMKGMRHDMRHACT